MIRKLGWFNALILVFVLGLIALLYWLTLEDPVDPCADPQTDISAAVLGDESGDQDALVNRAIIMRGACDKGEQIGGDKNE